MHADPPFRTFVEVSLGAIQRNFHAVAKLLPEHAKVMPVVKANAYGHGALPVSRALVKTGAEWLAVSNTAEAVALRQGGIEPRVRILVLGGIHHFDWAHLLPNQLTPVLHSIDDVRAFDAIANAAGLNVPFHFKFDTGLSRLGSREPIAQLIHCLHQLRAARLEAIMTHFASAADLSSPKTFHQANLLLEHATALRNAGIGPFFLHADATNSIHLLRHHLDIGLVRPGHSIYGYVTEPRSSNVSSSSSPSLTGRLHVEPALTWKAGVLLTKTLPPGVDVGYGSRYRTARPTTVAVLSVGYADGYPHQLTNRAYVLLHGQRAPVVGAVSMDLTIVDVSHIPKTRKGDNAILLGADGYQQLTAVQLGRMANTISYAVLSGISERVPRIYIEEES